MKIYCSPHTEDVENHLREMWEPGIKALHLVPTMILLRRRLKLYIQLLASEILNLKSGPSSVKYAHPDEIVRSFHSVYEVDEFIRDCVRKNSGQVLSRAESSVVLKRILIKADKTNHIGWLSEVSTLNNFFIELNETGLPASRLAELDTSEKWATIIEIYLQYLDELKNLNKMDLGQASHQALTQFDISQYDKLILDGAFLPITFKHHTLIRRFETAGKPVIAYLPYNKDQADQPAQKAIETIYSRYLPVSEWCSIYKKKPGTFFIEMLPERLFRSQPKIDLDNTVELMRFTTVENELNFVVKRIHDLIHRKQTDPRKIVIIMPNAMEFRPLVREISEQYELEVEVPERPFLHLLQGRALKHFYDLYIDPRRSSETYLDLPMMETFLQSGLLQTDERLGLSMAKIACFFTDCFSVRDWLDMLARLIDAKGQLDANRDVQHPLVHVGVDQLNQLSELVRDIHEIGQALVEVPAMTVRDHVNHLLDIIRKDTRIRIPESKVHDRLLMICQTLESQQRILLSALEFGERISAWFAEDEESTAIVNREPERQHKKKEGILVTSPQNVEYQRYRHVFITRFNQNVYPEKPPHDWLRTKEIERQILALTTNIKFDDIRELERFYADRALYHIYTAFCAADDKLTISYSQMDEGMELSPAHYLHDLAKIFGIEEGNMLENRKLPKLENLLLQYGVLKTPEQVKTIRSHTNSHESETRVIPDLVFLTVEDLGQYRYCPRKLYYQKTYPEESAYTDPFHLQAYASACLYERAVEKLVEMHPQPLRETNDFKQLFMLNRQIPEARRRAEPLVRPLFPLSTRVWHNVILLTEFLLKNLLDSIFHHPFVEAYLKKGHTSITIQLSYNKNKASFDIGGVTVAAQRELTVTFNNYLTYRYPVTSRKHFLFFSSNDPEERRKLDILAKRHYKFTSKFFYGNEKEVSEAIQQANRMISNMKQGSFPKAIGGHCKYCAFKELCKEREVK